ncbi:hypothetical protein D6764_03305 [Candidatus Woesearchaeota archaeon]|nr:MAG: hypothetical protein D6764_03305 [Candidatus Woesearchaeota archaeon]
MLMRKRSFLRYLKRPKLLFSRKSREEELVQQYVRRIYNPDSFALKPRFRRKLSEEERRKINEAVRRIYNP